MISKKTAFILVLFVFISGFVFSIFLFSSVFVANSPKSNYEKPKSDDVSKEVQIDEPKTQECPINGELFSKTQEEKWLKRRPMGIMVENHTEARPQSGISSADVVYEAVAEGGITRFLLIYYCNDSPTIGPVRSARIYFIRLLQGYGEYPLYAHVGGANTPGPADALGEIEEMGWAGYNDLNQFAVPFPNYWRDYERLPDVATEHTMYTSSVKLWKYAKDKRALTNIDSDDIAWDKDFEKWLFQDDAEVGQRGKSANISFGFWTQFANDYSVTWKYDPKTNFYSRTNGTAPHIDKNTGKQLMAKNIAVMFADELPANDGYEGGHLLYGVTGKGKSIVFQNGSVVEGTWVRTKDTDLARFYDENNEEIQFVRGKTFVEILPSDNKVTY